MSKYRSNKNQHLSVGVILKDNDGKYLLYKSRHGYSMMTGTLEDNESLEDCVHRELLEEFGATCKIDSFAGTTSILIETDIKRGLFYKNTIWFNCTLLTIGAPSEIKTIIKSDDLYYSYDNVDKGRWPIGLIK